MSSGTFTYTISAEEAARLARARELSELREAAHAAHGDCEMVRSELHRAELEHEGHDLDVTIEEPAAPASEEPEEWRNYRRALLAAAERGRSAIEAGRARARLRSLFMSSLERDEVSTPTARRTSRRTEASSDRAKERAALEASVERALARVPGDATGESRAKVEAEARRVLEAKPVGVVRTLLGQLSQTVREAQEEAQRLRVEREVAAELLVRLGEWGRQHESALAATLASAARGETRLDAAQLEHAHAITTGIAQGTRRRYVADVLLHELHRLGYGAGAEFETAIAEGGQILLQNSKLGEYRVQLRMDAANDVLELDVVRFGRPGESGGERRKALDIEAQSHFCSDIDQLNRALAAGGVELQKFRTTEPGERPVAALDENDASLQRRIVSKPQSRAHAMPKDRA